MQFDNAAIVLTGASSGIGLELARRLVRRNTIIGLSRNPPDCPTVRGAGSFIHIDTDLASAASVATSIRLIHERCPAGIDGLINCAAVQYLPKFCEPEFDPSTIAREIAVNLTSPIELIAGLLDLLLRRPEAFILNINSGLGLVPKRESAVYCATKAALDNFSRGLRAQLPGTGIRVMQAFLPLVDTPMTAGRGRGKLAPGDVADRIIAGIERGIVDHDIGKVGLLRAINRAIPSLAHSIMQKGSA